MNDIPKHSFEEQWKEAFDEASVSPDPALWDRLDAQLANQETQKYKRKLYVFKMRVAATVALLLLALGTWVMVNYKQSIGPDSSTQLASASTKEGGRGKEPESKEASPLPAEQTMAQTSPATHNLKDAGEEHSRIPELEKAQPIIIPDQASLVSVNKERMRQHTATMPMISRTTDKASNKIRSNTSVAPHHSSSETIETNIAYRSAGKQPAESVTTLAEKETVVAFVTEKSSTVIDEVASTKPIAFDRLNNKPVSIPNEINFRKDIRYQLDETYWAKLAVEDEAKYKNDEKGSRWQMGLAFTPGYSNPNIKVNESSPSYNAALRNVASDVNFVQSNGVSAVNAPSSLAPSASSVNSDLESTTPSRLSYQAGIRVQYALSRRIKLESGMQYLQNNSQFTTNDYIVDNANNNRQPVSVALLNAQSTNPVQGNEFLYAEVSPVTSTNMKAYAADPQPMEVHNRYEYLSIPLKVNYLVIDRKLDAGIGAGVSADIFLSNEIGNEEAGISNVKINSANGSVYRNVGVSAWIGVKLDYEFAKKFSVFVEPSYRRAVTSFTNSAIVRSMPYNFGVGTGLQYQF
jgi:hypothetical protein